MTQNCDTCEWWDAWTATCCNDKSEYCADYRWGGCDKWEKSEK